MNKYEVRLEAVITYEVTLEAENGQIAERLAEDIRVLEGGVRYDSVRALWTRDVTPVEERIRNMIAELNTHGYRVFPPEKKEKKRVSPNTKGDVDNSEPAPTAGEDTSA